MQITNNTFVRQYLQIKDIGTKIIHFKLNFNYDMLWIQSYIEKQSEDQMQSLMCESHIIHNMPIHFLKIIGIIYKKANINVVGNWRMPVLGDLNERVMTLEEVGEAVNEMKSGKVPGLDEFPVECLKKGGMAVLEFLVRLLNLLLLLNKVGSAS